MPILNFIFNLMEAIGPINCLLLLVLFIAFAIWIFNKSSSQRGR